MKKIIAMLAIASLAVSAQSAQINWGSSGALYNGTQQMTTANGYSTQAYLVYLGTSGSTWVSSGFDPTAPVAVGGDVLATKTANVAGSIAATVAPHWIFTPGVTTVGGDTITDGSSTFGIIFLSSGGAFGTQVNYLLSNPFVFDTTPAAGQGTWTAGSSTFAYGAPVPSGSTWTPVPEPATAALALAGLAMLIRRRK